MADKRIDLDADLASVADGPTCGFCGSVSEVFPTHAALRAHYRTRHAHIYTTAGALPDTPLEAFDARIVRGALWQKI